MKRDSLSQLQKLEDYVVLAVVDADRFQKTNIDIIQQLIRQNTPGVYVTLSKPYESVKKVLQKKNINLTKLIFIDGVTKTVGGRLEKTEDCLFIGNPKNLSDISIAMDQAIMAIPKRDKFLFFDSLSTLLLYNNPGLVAKFVHFISGKMRVWKVKGIIISLKRKQDKELINQLKEYCDITLEL